MNKQDRPVSADLRSLILLLFAAAVLSAGWRSSAPDRQASSYFLANGRLIRSGGRAGEGIRLDAGTVCADIPPELSVFFHLPLPMNRADQTALMRLPGIGPKLAESIITYRAEHGGIIGPDDLLKVKGIGPKRLANLTPLICFDANH